MLSSFYIKNYRNLRELRFDTLGQINLISGKNNTGKSSLLEAVYLYANRGSIESIVANLSDRKEYSRHSNSEEPQDENIKSLASLFFNRKVSFNKEDSIEIGCPDLPELMTLRFVYYNEMVERNDEDELIRLRPIIVDDVSIENTSDLSMGFEIKAGEYSRLLTFQRSLWSYSRSTAYNLLQSPNNQFIHTNNINREANSSLFDNITLTDKEQYIIEALKIIEPDTERIAFVDSGNKQERIALIKLSNSKDVIPLGSMGDGINRILTIILALVNCNDGYLLIDEFENGLHYTVQEQLWEVIFKLAKELNIQVFATTHSNDCISSFSSVLNRSGNKSLGRYIRLDNIKGEIKEVVFSSEELTIAEEQDIELR